ncbi:hypothetical protein [Curtobacterium sp. CFBP9011]|uniref:hypothetical protein n=1 Tax=Curtobacterium sp. CFBP9011 TaxID=3096530 RepID=UPI002A69A778|nr:hypothetical protein [Curtobacterium sp. CFBP9011]MDY1006470.1 hypothetical protein [Curtobacterium sp. CFBP9011]
MAVITDCTNRRAHRHTLHELGPIAAHADRVPRDLINKYIEFHEQPDARTRHRAATISTLVLRDLGTFLRTYQPMPLPKFGTSIEPILDIYNARAEAAETMLLADEHAAAYQLGITLNALRGQHWHTTNDSTDHTEKRGALAMLRAGLLVREPLHHALSICGVHGWDDLATFPEPDAPHHPRRPRNRSAATFYQRLPNDGEASGNPTFMPRGPLSRNRPKLSANCWS